MPTATMITAHTDRPLHFVIVTYPAQGHINPARHLARRLAAFSDARVTFCTALSAHRKMFPGNDGAAVDDGDVTYVPYSDGYDDGDVADKSEYAARSRVVGSSTLSEVLRRVAGADGRPPACVIYTLLLSWVAGVALEMNIPSALYWIQPATVFAAYFYFFHGHGDAISAAAARGALAGVELPGMPPLKIRDLPSFVTIGSADHPYYRVLSDFRNLFESLDREAAGARRRPTVLINTFSELEPEAVAAMRPWFEPVPIGPVLSFLANNHISDKPPKAAAPAKGKDLFESNGNGYMAWLDVQPTPRSVVYVSFGSLAAMSRRQVKEMAEGLRRSGRPFLWVVRKDNKSLVGDDAFDGVAAAGSGGAVVDWCDQVAVLSHPAVGCFLTHCGWNSTLESMAYGVPVVAVPQWTDQGTNAWLLAERNGAGVRAHVAEDGIVEAEEVERCIKIATAEGARKAAEEWKERARAAVTPNGQSERNLRAFVDHFTIGQY